MSAELLAAITKFLSAAVELLVLLAGAFTHVVAST